MSVSFPKSGDSSRGLIVAAFLPELEAFVDPRRFAEGPVVSVHGTGGEVWVSAVGIGLAKASSGLRQLLGTLRPPWVVAVGTCGAYPKRGLALGDVVVASSHVLGDPSVALQKGEFVGPPSNRVLEGDGPLVARMAHQGARAGRVATTLSVTTDDDWARALSDAFDADAEHLEAFGMATACADAGVPFVAVLGVANFVGPRGRQEWAENHRTTGRRAAELVRQALEHRIG